MSEQKIKIGEFWVPREPRDVRIERQIRQEERARLFGELRELMEEFWKDGSVQDFPDVLQMQIEAWMAAKE